MGDRKQVRLEFDPNNAHINHRDKYGRPPAYVCLEDSAIVLASPQKKNSKDDGRDKNDPNNQLGTQNQGD